MSRTTEQILRQWRGQDGDSAINFPAVAGEIDLAYQQHMAELPAQTAAIQAGQAANEARVDNDWDGMS